MLPLHLGNATRVAGKALAQRPVLRFGKGQERSRATSYCASSRDGSGARPRTLSRVRQADTHEHEHWADRILDATSLNDMFAAPLG
jgi:hypothetical protein